jgi:CMP-N-acetylneuraminic acid synthetase
MPGVFILIPAKGQSRRLKNKNVLPLRDRPLIWWAIDRACRSRLGDVFVSTESEWIIDYLMEISYQEEHVFHIIQRPSRLAEDSVRAVDVCLHAIEKVADGRYDTLLMTLPTSPLATADDLIKAYRKFESSGGKPVLSVTRWEGNPQTLIYSAEDGELLPASFPRGFYHWSREFVESGQGVKVYRSNGAVFICTIEEFKRRRDFYIDGMIGYEMPPQRGVDIDTILDYMLAIAIVSAEEGRLSIDYESGNIRV